MILDQNVNREVTYLVLGYHSNGIEFGQLFSDEMLKLKLRSPINIQLPTDSKI